MASKRQRRQGVLQDVVTSGSLSNSGLLKILKTLKVGPEDVRDASKREVDEAYHERFNKFRITATFPVKDGSTFDLEYAEPALLLAELIAESPCLSTAYKAALDSSPNREWDMVVAFDEYTPGNKLRPDNRRKVMNLYFSFLNLGQTALFDDVAWVVPLAIRHSKLVEVVGGWPHVLQVFLRRLLFGPHGLATVGLALLIEGRSYTMKARISCLLSDGEGIKVAFDWRGGSSMHPCVKHWNVLKKGSDLAHRRECCVEVTCSDATQYRPWSQSTISTTIGALNEAQRRVDAGALPKVRLQELQTGLGFNPNEHSLWLAADLRVGFKQDLVSSIRYDWCHSLLQDGVFSNEVYVFLKVCEPLGVTENDLHLFLKDQAWRWPAATRAKSMFAHRVFDAYRSASSATADKLKCGASELLGLYSMLRHFVEVKLGHRPEIVNERASFDAACQVLDVLLMIKRGVADIATGATALEAALSKHMQLHVRAYGDQHVKPKSHWMMDIPAQLRQDHCVLDAFVVERGHLLVKPVAENCKNLSTFERSTMAGVVNAMFHRGKVSKVGSGLRGTVEHRGGVAVAPYLLCSSGVHVSVGDVVFYGDRAGQVHACAEEGHLYVVVEELTKMADVTPHSAQWQPSGRNAVWQADDLEQASSWYTSGHGLTTVLSQ